ncbi:MAG: sugar ABC transporter ATP-binding protein [Lachnospiraceae bacterium]|nr:sugar ABC transporter ATP-binding protein [Lachnospiraceae bacterium]
MAETILDLKNITKIYPGVKALDSVSFDLHQGEIHALIGENGAGKSTLIKTLSGAVIPDAGKICFEGVDYMSMTPQLSKSLGIEIIYQEFNLMPSLSVAENIFMGERIGSKTIFNRVIIEKKTKEIFATMGINDIDPHKPVKELSVAYMQLVEIARSLSKNVKVLVMDEPTAPLTEDEVEILFDIIGKLKKKGVSIIFISHRLKEIFRIADRVTVMRDGKKIETNKIEQITREKLIKSMVGRELNNTYPQKECSIGEEILRLENVSGNGDKNISFALHKGEILGLAGLVGAGRTELARLLFGADPMEGGRVFLENEIYNIKSPKQAIEKGVGLIPEDRKTQGLILNFSIIWNTTMPILKQISKIGIIDKKREAVLVKKLVKELIIKTPSEKQIVSNLSGGNQQKVVLAKWLAANCKVLIFDEPTRGIDVGAKYEIYKLMNKLCEEGVGIIMISSDMEELIAMSDRMIVLCEGEQSGQLAKNDFSQEIILAYASGSK